VRTSNLSASKLVVGNAMSKDQMIKKSKQQVFFPYKISLVACFAVLSSVGITSNSFGQSSSAYHPGEGIKFHDLSGGSSSSGSNPSVTPGGDSSSSTTASPTSANSSTSSAAVNGSSTTGSSSGATPDATAPGAETGEKGFGSFLKNVVRVGAQVGNVQQNNYGSGQTYSNYGSAPQSYSRPNGGSSLGNYGVQQNYGNRPNYNSSRPDLVQGGNPFPGRHSAYDGAQNQVQISGDPMELVTKNPPFPVDGDIENLFPKELHTKAWGPELRRNGPLNGAEDNTHMF
jgi:hypothetical protein